jgi:hypothetical protein
MAVKGVRRLVDVETGDVRHTRNSRPLGPYRYGSQHDRSQGRRTQDAQEEGGGGGGGGGGG